MSTNQADTRNYFSRLSFGGVFERVFQVFGSAWGTFLCIHLITKLVSIGLSLLTIVIFIGTNYHKVANDYYYNSNQNINSEYLEGDDFYLNQYNNNNNQYNNGQGNVYGENQYAGSNSSSSYSYDDSSLGLAFLFFMLAELLIVYATDSIGNGASIYAVVSVYAGETPSVLDCFRAGFRKWWTLFGAMISIGLGLFTIFFFLWIFFLAALSANGGADPILLILFASAICSVIMMYVCVETFVVYPAIMVESCGPWQAISRSFHLLDNHFCDVFGILFLWGLFKFLVNGIVSSAFGGQNNAMPANESGSVRFDINLGGAGDGYISFALGVLFAAIGSM